MAAPWELAELISVVAGGSLNGHKPADFTPPADTLVEWIIQGRPWLDIIRAYPVYGSDLQKLLTSIGSGAPGTPPAPSRYKLCPASDALGKMPDIEWVITDLLSTGSMGIIVGKPGSKKTYAALDMGICVAIGAEWLGRAVKQGPVLFIDEESGLVRILRRLNEVMTGHQAGPGLPFHFTTLDGFNLRTPEGLADLEEAIKQIRPVLLIIDALPDVIPGADENSSEDVLPALLKLREWASRYNLAELLLHHPNKTGGYRGSSSILGACDLMIEIESKQGESYVKFDLVKCRDAEPFTFAANAIFDPVQGSVHFALTATKQTGTSLPPCEQWILDYLTANGPSRMSDLVKQAGSQYGRSSLSHGTSSLKNAGLVQFKANVYSVIP